MQRDQLLRNSPSVPSPSLIFVIDSMSEAVSRLSPRVTRIMGHNPGPFTLQGTNTYLVGRGADRVLIDTGEGRPAYRQSLQEALETAAAELGAPVRIASVLLTHAHPDHIGGLATVKELHPAAVVYKLPCAGELQQLQQQRSYMLEGVLVMPPPPVLRADEGTTLEVLPTPGHTEDHACVRLQEEEAVFTGDTILGQGTSAFSCYFDYMRSLEALRALRPRRLYCAHGPTVEDGVGKIEEMIAHRQGREDQILALLKEHRERAARGREEGRGKEEKEEVREGEGVCIMDLVPVMYSAAPRVLWPAAAANVLHHLKKLIAEGRVVVVGEAPRTTPDLLSRESDYTLFGERAAEADHGVADRVFNELRVALAD